MVGAGSVGVGGDEGRLIAAARGIGDVRLLEAVTALEAIRVALVVDVLGAVALGVDHPEHAAGDRTKKGRFR